MNLIRPGDRFKLKNDVTIEALSLISYGQDHAKLLLNDYKFVAVECPEYYKDTIKNKIWYILKNFGACYLNPEMVEPLEPKEYNHPLTKIFKL